MECTSCGETLDRRDVFCSKCGELTRGQPLGRELGTALTGITKHLSELSKWATDNIKDEANRTKVIVGGVIIALLLVSATVRRQII